MSLHPTENTLVMLSLYLSEKQLLHQQNWLRSDSGHFLWDFLRLLPVSGNCLIHPTAPLISVLHHFLRWGKSMNIFDLKVDRWKWCHSPSAWLAAWDSHWHDPSRAKRHPPLPAQTMCLYTKMIENAMEMPGVFLQHWNLNIWHFDILRHFEAFCAWSKCDLGSVWVIWIHFLAPAALSRCGKSNPRWHSCWRSYHLSNLPKRALCSGTFFFSNFCTFREHSSTWIKGYKMLQDATSTITLKQHTLHQTSMPHPNPPWPGTSTKESAKRMNSAFALRSSGVAMATKVISCSEPNSVKVHRRIDRIASSFHGVELLSVGDAM